MSTGDAMASGWTVSFRADAWLWSLLVLAAGVVAWYAYRRTVPPISERWRVALVTLRLLAVAGLLVAALGPRLEWSGVAKRKPRVTVLVDQSESLSFTDPEGARPDVVRQVLAGQGMERILSGAQVTWQGFAHSVSPLDPEHLSFTGNASAIGDALLEQRRLMPPPDRVILITDGANTSGPDPVRAAEDIKLPMYVIGVGDTDPQKDLRIVGVSAPGLTLAGRPMNIAVTVENIGLPTRPVKIRVTSGGKVMTERAISLPPPGRRADVELAITPSAPGILRGVVSLDSIPGEILARNNLWPFTTHVLKAKSRLLILAGAPSGDVAFWMRFLREREDLDTRLWVASHPPQVTSPPTTILDSLADVDLILWHELSPNGLPDARLREINDAVGGGAGLLAIPGRYDLPRAWGAMLPVEVGRGRYVAQHTEARLTSNASRHPVFSTDIDFPRWSMGWSSLPPLLGRVVGLAATSGGSVLMTGEGDPLAVAGTYRSGRVVVFGGLTYWRWDMIPRGLGDPNPASTAFWTAVVRWLSTRQELSRVRVQTDSPLYRLGEPVRFTVQAYDEKYEPLDGADARLDVDAGALGVAAASQGEGRYVAEVTGLSPGEHKATATASVNGVGIGSSSAEFAVTVVGLEHEETRQQRDVLEAVARAGNGGYAAAQQADSLLAAIPLDQITEQRERTISVGSSLWILWSIVGLLAVEWVGRRVLGLL